MSFPQMQLSIIWIFSSTSCTLSWKDKDIIRGSLFGSFWYNFWREIIQRGEESFLDSLDQALLLPRESLAGNGVYFGDTPDPVVYYLLTEKSRMDYLSKLVVISSTVTYGLSLLPKNNGLDPFLMKKEEEDILVLPPPRLASQLTY